ncbi:DUF1989 domain-containing protein [Jeotgalibacillus sp. S-D1]|uniref:urea amidolyase associated protein UAAP1 n=1 Tax=Jeotgalibacillus sp. S-D1 TaxID=2552189 RepID=UPI0010598C0B|nr:urea amidolyase associated protein UAAP1 [Jeotgalibacillus sp. S-D1]TDL31114.1 DUF1989 domain-containing protein [Jeotgalibacillus sp. S-D1]
MEKIWSLTLGSGAKWSGKVSKGKLLRFTALEDGANLSGLLFNADDLTESYNMPDTLKAQYTARLTKGNVLMSDNGRAMASFVEDDLQWHDPIGGYTTRQLTDKKYGTTAFQENQNEWYRSGEENLAMELVRNGLQLRDMVPVFNLFSKIQADEQGAMHFAEGHCKKGDTVTMRTEMDVVLLLSNTPSPLDPRTHYPSVPVEIEVLHAEPVKEDDYCVNHRHENKRAFENTWDYYKLAAQ